RVDKVRAELVVSRRAKYAFQAPEGATEVVGKNLFRPSGARPLSFADNPGLMPWATFCRRSAAVAESLSLSSHSNCILSNTLIPLPQFGRIERSRKGPDCCFLNSCDEDLRLSDWTRIMTT